LKDNKKVIEEELANTKKNQLILLQNFNTFKSYLEKILSDFASKLKTYNQKEQIYEEIASENDQLKLKCRDLLEKLKVVSQNLHK
jgi:hypothetical protein